MAVVGGRLTEMEIREKERGIEGERRRNEIGKRGGKNWRGEESTKTGAVRTGKTSRMCFLSRLSLK